LVFKVHDSLKSFTIQADVTTLASLRLQDEGELLSSFFVAVVHHLMASCQIFTSSPPFPAISRCSALRHAVIDNVRCDQQALRRSSFLQNLNPLS
jgi:hypothetical protein